MRTTVAITVAAAIVAGAVGFFGGITYQKTKQPARPAAGGFALMRDRADGRTNTVTAPRGGAFGGGMTMGEITAMDEKSITVKFRDGSSKIVILAATTKYTQSQETTVGELKTGENVAVFGTVNPDGSLTATSIQLNPEMRNLPEPVPTQ